MVINILTDLIESIGYILFLSKYLNKNDKYRKEYTSLMVLISFVILQVNSIFNEIDDISTVAISIFGFIYSYLFFSNSILEILFALLFSESMILFTNILALTTASYILQISFFELISVPFDFEIVSLSSGILYIVISIGLLKIKRTFSSVSSKSMIYLFFAHLIIFISVAFLFIKIMNGTIKFRYAELIVLMLSSMFILLYFMYNNLKEENEKNIENIIINIENKNMKEYIETISLIYEENKIIRHDLKNILLVLKDETNSKEETLKDIEQHIYTMPIFFTSNNTFNDIVNSKIKLYKDKNIDWRFYIESDLHNIKRIDLAIILGNLLDNACENIGKESVLEIRTKIVNNHYLLNISNSIDFSVLETNKKLISNKSKKELHGYGLKSIKNIVENYNGNILFSEDDGFFSVDIFLEIPIITK